MIVYGSPWRRLISRIRRIISPGPGCLLLAVAALIVSCALPGLKHRDIHTFLLEWNGAPTPSADDACATLLVISPLAAPGYDTAQMAYVEQNHQLDYFATHRWADTPARMLSPLIARALEASGLFKAVVESPSPVDAQLRLQSKVLALRQIFTPDESAEQVSLKVDLFDLTQSRLLASRVFSVIVPTTTRNPYGGVVAANRAIDRVFKQMIAFLAGVVAGDPPDCIKKSR